MPVSWPRIATRPGSARSPISEGGHGPLALYLALEEPDRFVTLSVWSSWSALEVATGGDVGRPVATRHEERLLAWEAAHYEVLPNMTHPRSPAVT